MSGSLVWNLTGWAMTRHWDVLSENRCSGSSSKMCAMCLLKMKLFSSDNDAQRISYDDLFMQRRFGSVIFGPNRMFTTTGRSMITLLVSIHCLKPNASKTNYSILNMIFGNTNNPEKAAPAAFFYAHP